MYHHAGACAELILADKKDSFYENEIKNLLRELLDRCYGTHVLSQLLPELTTLSSLLYYLLILGRSRPQQTLGEEYCNVMRITLEDKEGSSLTRIKHVRLGRHLLWILVAVVPSYIAARSRTGWIHLSQLTLSPRERMALQMRQRQTTTSSPSIISSPMTTSSFLTSCLQAIDRIVGRINAIFSSLQAKFVPTSYEGNVASTQQWLLQFHLALFYISAKYYHIAKRIIGIKYVFVRNDIQRALRLSLVGYLMMIRLSMTFFCQLYQLHKAYKQAARQKLQGLGVTRHVPLRVPCTTEPVISSKKCALCLGSRTNPATTPCGHVFCWECIIGWCQKNKTECQQAHPQQIKCIYNYY